MKKLIIVLLAVCLLSLTACSNISATNLMLGINKQDFSPIEINSEYQNKTDEIMDFSLEILEKSFDEENICKQSSKMYQNSPESVPVNIWAKIGGFATKCTSVNCS